MEEVNKLKKKKSHGFYSQDLLMDYLLESKSSILQCDKGCSDKWLVCFANREMGAREL